MGEVSSKQIHGDRIVDGAAARIGKFAVNNRYHKEGTEVLTDKYFPLKETILGKGYNGAVYKARAKEAADYETCHCKPCSKEFKASSAGYPGAEEVKLPVICPTCHGPVNAGRIAPTGKVYAVKDLNIQSLSSRKMADVEAECELFLSMDHQHVCRLVDVYQSPTTLSLIMECMDGGELFKRVNEKDVAFRRGETKELFGEINAADFAYQMLLALSYIHGREIVHRDIKLENWLLESKDSDNIKLIDFGFSKAWEPSTQMKMACGTLSYVAPEVIERDYNGGQSDMWSFGVCVFILLLGYMPFSGGDKDTVVLKISKGFFEKKVDKYYKLSTDASNFISNLFVVDPSKRLTAAQALKHPFITKRSERAKSSEKGEIGSSTALSLLNFARASEFRRMCLTAIAWTLTSEERDVLHESFLKMDSTKTGVIKLQDFKAVLEATFHIDDAQMIEAFERLDSSNTDEIHYTDFLAAMVSSKIRQYDQVLRDAFRKFDISCTGFIDPNDLKLLLGESESEEVALLLEEADFDNDGKLSYEDFIQFVQGDYGYSDDPEHAEKRAKRRAQLLEVGHKMLDNEISKMPSCETCTAPACEVATTCGETLWNIGGSMRNII